MTFVNVVWEHRRPAGKFWNLKCRRDAGAPRLRQRLTINLFFEAGSGAIAKLHADGAIVDSDFSLRLIAPTRAREIEWFASRREKFIGLRGNEHFFGSKMLADGCRFHG